jgi:hypothetical protein
MEPIPCAARRPVAEVDPIKPLAAAAFDPQCHGTDAHPKLACHRSHAFACSNQFNHLPATPPLRRLFLAMTTAIKKPTPYSTCSANAVTQVFGER